MEALIDSFPPATKLQLLKQLESMNEEQKRQFYETQVFLLLRLHDQHQLRRKLREQKQQQNEQQKQQHNEQASQQAAAAQSQQTVTSDRQALIHKQAGQPKVPQGTQKHQLPNDVSVKAEGDVKTEVWSFYFVFITFSSYFPVW